MSAATDERPERLRDRAAARRARVGGWLHDRTGHRGAFDWWTNRRVPGGARWRYATGPVCLGLFAAVFATGLVMMTGYVPSADGSWASVQYMERTPGGSLVRGVHFWATHALIVAFAVHLARLMLAAAFRSPRELAWVSGVLLVPLLAGLAVTGNPLAGSQKAFEQIEVEGAILGGTPVAGPALKRMLFGGAGAGHLTLTHLYALHVALLPLAAALVGGLHLYQLLRWGTVRPEDRAADGDPDTVTPAHDAAEPDAPYVPDQLLRNAVAFAGAFAVVYYMALNHAAPLDAPPGPAAEGAPRPEWYFRFLFELRNYVPPAAEFLATGVFPAAALGLLIAVPWIDRLGHRIGAAVRYVIVFGGLTAWCALTAASMSRDQADPHYREVMAAAGARAGRAADLARLGGVPPEGPGVLLARDPLTRGPELFRAHCAACHAHAGRGAAGPSIIEAADCGGANLAGFGSRAWHRGLLNPAAVDGPAYFGCTPFAGGDMPDYVQNTLWGEIDPDDPAAVAELNRKLAAVAAALAAEAGARVHGGPPIALDHGGETLAPADLNPLVEEGKELIAGEFGCTDCHNYGDADDGYSADLNGYGSRDWLAGLIANPAHDRYYGEEADASENPGDGYMPAYAPTGTDADTLTREDVLLLADWLRGDWVGR